MSIVASELVLTGCANHQETDAGTPQGGAQALDKKIVFADLTVNDQIEIVSDDAADTVRQWDVVGKNAAGVDVTENLTTNGTTPVVTTATYERLNKVVRTVPGGTPGTLTVQRDGAAGVLMTLEDAAASATGVEITECRKIYIGLVVPAVTDAFYEKLFYGNEHATLTLTAAKIQLSDVSDPTGTDLKIGGAATVDDSGTTTNRLTPPGGVVFVDNQVDQNAPGDGNLDAGEALGIWIENTVTGGAAAIKASFNIRLSGQTI